MSSSALASASVTIFSISSSDSPPEAWIVIDCSLSVALSFAETFSIPLASISNETSIWGIPLGAAGIPSKLNNPNCLFSLACFLSPWTTLTVTAVWLSSAVENIWDLLVGIVVFFSITGVITPPIVSIPRVSGVTSKSKISVTSPDKTAPCTAAPTATASSGLISFLGSLPKNSLTFSWNIGILVCPPTRITSLISEVFNFASLRAISTGFKLLAIKGSTRASSFDLVSLIKRCFGPEESAVM